MFNIMKQAKEMQQKMQSLQEEVEKIECHGDSGGGLVSVTLSGKGFLKNITISPSLAKSEEIEILEDLIIAAHNNAKEKLEKAIAEKTQDLTQGLPLPDNFKLPF